MSYDAENEWAYAFGDIAETDPNGRIRLRVKQKAISNATNM
jgi:hypothetical protein